MTYSLKSVSTVTECISDHNDPNKHIIVWIKELDNWNEECRQTKVNKL